MSEHWTQWATHLWNVGCGHLSGEGSPEDTAALIERWLGEVSRLSAEISLLELRGRWHGPEGSAWRAAQRSALLQPGNMHPALAGEVLAQAVLNRAVDSRIIRQITQALPGLTSTSHTGLFHLRTAASFLLHLHPHTLNWKRPDEWNELQLNVDGYSQNGTYLWETFPLISGEEKHGRIPLRERSSQVITGDLALTWALQSPHHRAASIKEWLFALQACGGHGAPRPRRNGDVHSRPNLAATVRTACQQVAFTGLDPSLLGEASPDHLPGWLHVAQQLADDCSLNDEDRLMTGMLIWKVPDKRLFLRDGAIPAINGPMKRALLSSGHPLSAQLWSERPSAQPVSGTATQVAPSSSGQLFLPLKPDHPEMTWQETAQATEALQARWATSPPLGSENVHDTALNRRLGNLVDSGLTPGLIWMHRQLLHMLTGNYRSETINAEAAREWHLRLEAGHQTLPPDRERLSWADRLPEPPEPDSAVSHRRLQQQRQRHRRNLLREQISTPLPPEALLRALCMATLSLKTEDPQQGALPEVIALQERASAILTQRGRTQFQPVNPAPPTYTFTHAQLVAFIQKRGPDETQEHP